MFHGEGLTPEERDMFDKHIKPALTATRMAMLGLAAEAHKQAMAGKVKDPSGLIIACSHALRTNVLMHQMIGTGHLGSVEAIAYDAGFTVRISYPVAAAAAEAIVKTAMSGIDLPPDLAKITDKMLAGGGVDKDAVIAAADRNEIDLGLYTQELVADMETAMPLAEIFLKMIGVKAKKSDKPEPSSPQPPPSASGRSIPLPGEDEDEDDD